MSERCRSCCCTVSVRARRRGCSSLKCWRDAPRAGVGCAGLWRIHAGRGRIAAQRDYANVLKQWLDALGIERCVLLGHSLGAIIAGAFAAAQSAARGRFAAVVAGWRLRRGVGGSARNETRSAPRHAERTRPARSRRKTQHQYVVRSRERRSPRMGALEHVARDPAWLCAGDASARQRRSRQRPRALQRPHQRGGRRRRHHHAARQPASDSRSAAGTKLQVVPRAGHAGYIEAPAAYTAIIDTFCRASDGQRSQ